MGYQIELDDQTVRRIILARTLAQDQQDREEESLDVHIERILKVTSEEWIVFHTDFDRLANGTHFDDERKANSEYVDENIDQIEAKVATEYE